MHILIYSPFHPVLFLLKTARLWTLCSKPQVADSELHYALKTWNKDVTESTIFMVICVVQVPCNNVCCHRFQYRKFGCSWVRVIKAELPFMCWTFILVLENQKLFPFHIRSSHSIDTHCTTLYLRALSQHYACPLLPVLLHFQFPIATSNVQASIQVLVILFQSTSYTLAIMAFKSFTLI